MAITIKFYDEENNEMECYINDKNKLFIQVGQLNEGYYAGYIVLNKDDVKKLIEVLSETIKKM